MKIVGHCICISLLITVPYDVIYFSFLVGIKEDKRSYRGNLGVQEPTYIGTMNNGKADVVYNAAGYPDPSYWTRFGRGKRDQETFRVVRRRDGNGQFIKTL